MDENTTKLRVTAGDEDTVEVNASVEHGAEVEDSSSGDSPFRFLDLPRELRFMVYERLTLTIKHYTLDLPTTEDSQLASLSVIFRSLPLGILSTCRVVYDEAYKIMQQRIDNEVLDQPPKLIYTCQDTMDLDLGLVHVIQYVIDIQVEQVKQNGRGAKLSWEMLKSKDICAVDKTHEHSDSEISYIAWSMSTLLNKQRVLVGFLLFIKQAAAQLALRGHKLLVVLDLRDSGGRDSASWPERRVALRRLHHYAGEQQNVNFAGFVTSAGYEAAPRADIPNYFPTVFSRSRFQPLDETTWKNEWLES